MEVRTSLVLTTIAIALHVGVCRGNLRHRLFHCNLVAAAAAAAAAHDIWYEAAVRGHCSRERRRRRRETSRPTWSLLASVTRDHPFVRYGLLLMWCPMDGIRITKKCRLRALRIGPRDSENLSRPTCNSPWDDFYPRSPFSQLDYWSNADWYSWHYWVCTEWRGLWHAEADCTPFFFPKSTKDSSRFLLNYLVNDCKAFSPSAET